MPAIRVTVGTVITLKGMVFRGLGLFQESHLKLDVFESLSRSLHGLLCLKV